MLVSRPVIAFALLRQCSEMMRTDLLSGVAVLVKPLVSDLVNQVFDSRILAARLADAYGISIPSSALEGMTQRLVSADILRIEKTEAGLARALYSAQDETAPVEPDAEAEFQAILDDFLRHANELLAAVGKEFPEKTLTTGFLRHLATLDFSAIRAKPTIAADTGRTLLGPAAREQQSLSVELAEQATLDSLVASYIASLEQHQPTRLSLLAKVADGALAAELVFDLQAPTSVSRLTNTTVVVDTPLILSYLDLSSTQDTTDVRKLFDQIREMGAKVAAFQHSIEEAEGVLRAIQSARSVGDAYGPSVHRLSNSMFRAYFESMFGSIARVWGQTDNFEIIPEAATHFHKNFTQIEEDELVSEIRLSAFDRVLTRERDAKSVAETWRRLAGAHIPVGNVASCKFIFATPNASLQRRVDRFLKRKNLLLDGEFNPIVTSRYLSGLCWLLCGGKADQSPTVAKLLANCAAALRLKPELAERTKRFLAAVDPEKARHFEVMMTNERASQYLVEVTLGDANVITANNAEDIYEEVQRRAAEKVAVEKDTEYRGTIAALQSAVRAGDDAADALQRTLAETQLEVDARKMEIRDLAERSARLEANHAESQRRIAEQNQSLKELSSSAANSTETANLVQRQLAESWARGRTVASRFADRRANQIRWLGVISLFSLSLGIGYLDKFIVPNFEIAQQRTLNLLVVILQALLAISGASLLVDPVIRRPLRNLRQRLYKQRLAELGIPDDQEFPNRDTQ